MFLIANEHELASSLAFYMKEKRSEGPKHPPVYIPAQPYFEDQYSFWPRYDELIDFTPEIAPRRPGDPDRIVATGEAAGRDLDWKMRHSLADMVTSAWNARKGVNA